MFDGKKFPTSRVTSIMTPEDAIQGRAKWGDFTFVIGYSPPPGGKKKERLATEQSCESMATPLGKGWGSMGDSARVHTQKKWNDWLDHGAFSCLDTFHNIGGTDFSAKGNGSKIDHFFVLGRTEERLHLCIPYRSARRLQLIPDKYAIEHVPMIC